MDLTWQEILKRDKSCPYQGCSGQLKLGRGSTCGCPFMECDKCQGTVFVTKEQK